MTPPRRTPRRRRVDLDVLTMSELAEVAERLAVVRQALAVVTVDPDQAAVVLRRLRPLAADLRAVIRRLDDLSPGPSPGAVGCARCGRPLPAEGHKRRWCSQTCRQRAYEARRDSTGASQ